MIGAPFNNEAGIQAGKAYVYDGESGSLLATFTGVTSGRKAEQMQAQADRYEALRRWAEAGIPAEVRVAVEDVQRARKDMAEAKVALPRTKQWMVRSSADYAAGLGDARDLTDAVEAYIIMRTQGLEATQRLNVALAALAKATGTIVRGDGPCPGRPASAPSP